MTRIKPRRKKSPEHLARIAMLPCCICGYWPVEVHHIRSGVGMGQKSSDLETIPLCVWHHRIGPVAFHNGPGVFRGLFGSERELLAITLEKLEVK